MPCGFVYSFFPASSVFNTAPVGRSVCTDHVRFLSNNIIFWLTLISTKSFSLWQRNCWSVYPWFNKAESSKLSIQRQTLSLLMECQIAKNLLMEAMQRMLYTGTQNKRVWEDSYYAYNLVRMVLKLSELHCNEPGTRGTSAFWISKLSLWRCLA